MVKAFENDRDYTYEALIEQLNLIELHFRDGSWRECKCNPQKHLPTVSGLASEGIGFTENQEEKKFMEKVRDNARGFYRRLNEGQLTDEEADDVRSWAREMRRRVATKQWYGELPKTSRKDDFGSDVMFTPMEFRQRDEESSGSGCPTCTTIPEKYRSHKPTDVRHIRVSPTSMKFDEDEVQFVEY